MYDGPGIYRHYKGGYYRVIGTAWHESNDSVLVIYYSYDLRHELDRKLDDVDFIARPLNEKDLRPGDDSPFNAPPLHVGLAEQQARFIKVK